MLLKVKKIKPENGKYLSIILEKPKQFNFYPGQYLDLGREFTISSSPTEKFLMVTIKTGISDLKKKLQSLKKGDCIESSHPAGTFILDESSPAVFIAGGIGITPFRSMLKYVLDNNLNIPITLIYSNSDDDFIFKKELKSWQKQLPNLTIHWINTSTKSRLNRQNLQPLLAIRYQPLAVYYLAGTQTFVENIKTYLLDLKIDDINIRTDEFDGYV